MDVTLTGHFNQHMVSEILFKMRFKKLNLV